MNRSERIPKVRNALIAASTAVGCALVAAYYLTRPESDPLRLAQKQAGALVASDAESLYAMAPDYERNRYHLGPEQIERFRKEFLLPKLKGIRITRFRSGSVTWQTGQAILDYVVRLSDGRSIDFVSVAQRSPEGTRSPLVNAILGAWRIDEMTRKRLPNTSLTSMRAYLDGIRKDKKLLTSLGIEGVSLSGAHGRFHDWDTLEKEYAIGLDMTLHPTRYPRNPHPSGKV